MLVKRQRDRERAAYRTAVKHAAEDLLARRKLHTLALQRSVSFCYVVELRTALWSDCPKLYQLEDLGSDVVIDFGGTVCSEKRNEIVHEFARRNLENKVVAPIFDASVGELQMVNFGRGWVTAGDAR